MKKSYQTPTAELNAFAMADVLAWSNNEVDGQSNIGFDASKDLNWN